MNQLSQSDKTTDQQLIIQIFKHVKPKDVPTCGSNIPPRMINFKYDIYTLNTNIDPNIKIFLQSYIKYLICITGLIGGQMIKYIHALNILISFEHKYFSIITSNDIPTAMCAKLDVVNYETVNKVYAQFISSGGNDYSYFRFVTMDNQIAVIDCLDINLDIVFNKLDTFSIEELLDKKINQSTKKTWISHLYNTSDKLNYLIMIHNLINRKTANIIRNIEPNLFTH